MKYILLIAVLLLAGLWAAVPGPVYASTTYYVSPTGNDGNAGTGTGDGAAWLTIQHAVDNISAGDTIEVLAGTYNELVEITADGSSGNYCTLTNYGSDTVTVDGDGLDTGSYTEGLIYFNKANYWVLDGLYIYDTTQVGGDATDDYPGISVNGSDHVTITSCHTELTGTSGIWLGFELDGDDTDSTNLTVTYNTIYDANNFHGQEALSVAGVSTAEIAYNTIYGTHKEGIDIKSTTQVDSTVELITVHHNTIHDVVGPGIYISTGNAGTAQDCELYCNHIYNIINDDFLGITPDKGVFVIQSEGSAGGELIEDIFIYNNVMGYNSDKFVFNLTPNGNGTCEYNDIRLYNNTIYYAGGTFNDCIAVITDDSDVGADGFDIYNNLCIGTWTNNEAESINFGDADTYALAQVVVDYNWFEPSANDSYKGTNATESTDPHERAGDGTEEGSMLTAASSGVIDGGSNTLSPTYDYWGQTRGSSPSIGAFEYVYYSAHPLGLDYDELNAWCGVSTQSITGWCGVDDS